MRSRLGGLAAAAVEQSGVVRRNRCVRAELPGQRVADHRRRHVAEQASPRGPGLTRGEAVEMVGVVDHAREACVRVRAAALAGVHGRRSLRAPGSGEPSVAGGLVQDRARRDDEAAREPRLGARRGSAPDRVRDPERVAVLRAGAAVRPDLICGEGCRDVRGLWMGLSGRSDAHEHEQADCREPEEVLLTAHADHSPFRWFFCHDPAPP